MSHLRENSKCGFRSNNDETHVLSPPLPSTSTSTSSTSTLRGSVDTASSSSSAQSGKQHFDPSRRNTSGEISDMEISIQIPLSKERRDSEIGSDNDNDSVRENVSVNVPNAVSISSGSGSSGGKNLRRGSSVSVVVVEDDENEIENDNENDNDSDPPVENYNLFRIDFQDQDQDAEDQFQYHDGHDGVRLNVSPMTIEEQRQQQKRRAQSQHRKRKKSATNVDASYIPPYRKRFRRSVLPSKFLLGGNIRDPLNLASLADAKVNAALNAETPKSSPVPIPLYRHGEVPVFIPKNPDDPLGLQCEAENPYDFIAGIRKNSKQRKHRNRKKGGRKRTNSECSVDKSEDQDSDGKETKDKDSSVSSEEEKSKIVEKPKSKMSKPLLPPTGAGPSCGTGSGPGSVSATGSASSSGNHSKKYENIKTLDDVAKNIPDVSNPEAVVKSTLEGVTSGVTGELPLPKGDTETTAKGSEIIEVKLSTENASTVPEASSSTNDPVGKSEPGSVSGVGNKAATGAATTAASTSKKKSRHRRRMRKFGGGQFVPTGYFRSAKTSDYVPLGTPSIHEPSYWYNDYTPNSGDSYLYDINALPFESPSLTNYCDTLETEEPRTSGPQPHGMEPFSPPPKQEAKRRRIDTEAETESTAATNSSTINISVAAGSTAIVTTSSTITTLSIQSSNKKPELPKPNHVQNKSRIKPSGVPANTTADKNELATFVRPNPPNRLLTRANFRRRFRHKADPIVSPVIPQPGCRRRFGHGHHNHSNYNNYHGHGHGHKRPGNDNCDALYPISGAQNQYQSQNPNIDQKLRLDECGMQQKEDIGGEESSRRNTSNSNPDMIPKFRKKDEIFQYGNYNRYYGYRTAADGGDDLRLKAFPKGFFYGQDILDVGCNIGHVTLTIARDAGAKLVMGIDIDPKLIQVAKKNIKHYVDRDPADETIRFPHSCPMMYGVLQPPPGTVGDKRKIPFPYNVSFKHENYVLESDEMLEDVKPEYDIILCLSISKWIHLNYGDSGLKRFFLRAFRHLRPGGKLVLEPQPWSSYRKKKKLTERIFTTYKSIRFYPDKFQDYLLYEVGFSTVDKLATPAHHSKGFQRPLMIFTKANDSNDANTQDTDTEIGTKTERETLEKDKSMEVEVVAPHSSSEQQDQVQVDHTTEASEAVAVSSSSSPDTQKNGGRVNVPVSSSTITSSTSVSDPCPDPDMDFEECQGAIVSNTSEIKPESSSAAVPSPSSSSYPQNLSDEDN